MSSGVEGKVVTKESVPIQEPVKKTVLKVQEVANPEPVPEPAPIPQPVKKQPVYLGDPFCGIPWPRDKERWDTCMASSERVEYMARLQ